MDDRRRDGGTNSTLGTKEQGTHLTLSEHDNDDDDDDVSCGINIAIFNKTLDSIHSDTFQRVTHIFQLKRIPWINSLYIFKSTEEREQLFI